MALTPAQVKKLAIDAGFSPDQATIMTAIAGAESGFNPTAHNPVPPDDSYGLWQINMLGSMGPQRRAQFGIGSNTALYDPATNARAAKAVFDQQGFGAWSTWSSGSYRKFLGGAQVPAAPNGGSSGDGGPIPTLGPTWAPWNWPADAGNAAVGAAQGAAGQTAQTVLAGIGPIIVKGAFVVLGVALIGAGIVRGLATEGRRELESVPPIPIPV